MKADEIIESLDTVENLVSNIKKGVKERKDEESTIWGSTGKNSNSNLKDKIRIARGW